MSNSEYERNRQRLAEIQNVDLSTGEYNCHHWFIFRRDVKRNPELKPRLNKIDNLFLLPVSEHERVEELLEGQPPIISSPKKDHGKRSTKHGKRCR